MLDQIRIKQYILEIYMLNLKVWDILEYDN